MNRFVNLLIAISASLGLAACGAPQAEDPNAQAPSDEAMSETEEVVNGMLEAFAEASENPNEAIVAEARNCNQAGAQDAEFSVPDLAEGQALADYNASVSAAFLAQNSANACVFSLPSGLQFRVNRSADGASPNPAGELVEVHYEGTLIDGAVFDSSYARGEPSVFPSNRLISGWVEALPLMNVGEEWTLFIPSDLAYGANPRPGGPIGPNQALIFRMELISLPNRPVDQQ